MHVYLIFFNSTKSKNRQGHLWSKPTNLGNLGSRIVVWNVRVSWDHHIAIGAIREGVTIGLVQVAGSWWVTGAVISVVGYVGWRRCGCCPARLEGCSSRVWSKTIDWISINSIADQGLGRSSGGSSDAGSRNLNFIWIFSLFLTSWTQEINIL